MAHTFVTNPAHVKRDARLSALTTRHFSWDGETGKTFERGFLGECTVRHHGKMSFYKALKLVRDNQPKQIPPDGFMLRMKVADLLGVEPRDVELLTAVGSTLDEHFQVDGCMMWQGYVITFDVTMNRNKDATRAHVLVTRTDIENGCEEVACQIVRLFKYAMKYPWKKGVIRLR